MEPRWAAAGDFDGDGAEELGMAYAKWKDNDFGVGVLLFKYDANFQTKLTSANAKWSENNRAGTSFAMTAGHFQGAAADLPVASVALCRWSRATAPAYSR